MPKMLAVFFVILGLNFNVHADPWPHHDFLTEQYDRMHDSAMQQKFRQLAPMPLGAVYVQRPGEEEKEIRHHFRTMRELGFTALKEIGTVPGWEFEDVALIALQEGLVPWWFGEGGWEPITDELLDQLGLSPGQSMQKIRQDPRMIEYQMARYRERVNKLTELRQQGKELVGRSVAYLHEAGGRGPHLAPEWHDAFLDWLKERYSTIDHLNAAYNRRHYGLGQPFESWQQLTAHWQETGSQGLFIGRDYIHLRDIFRFKADQALRITGERIKKFRAFDPHTPFRGGGEMSLFLPIAYWGVDMEGIAELMTDVGTFYPSIHLAWHFENVDHEVVRPVYMMASYATDIFKGGWAASWESTGGPQQFNGGKTGSGFTVNKGTMTQLMLSYLAAGFKGFGLWCWSSRSAGREAGEYSLLDRHNQVTPRAIRVGQIGQAARRYRDELWQAHKEPLVGVYMEWNNEAVWAAMSVQERDTLRQWPISARAGVSRALMNRDIPFEYVTANDLLKGLGPRYPIIYMPFILSISDSVMQTLFEYVRQGGRLVMDMPSAWYDEHTQLLPTRKGTTFEKIFGTVIDEYQYSGTNQIWTLNGMPLHGFTIHTTPTRAEVVAAYDNGLPAITEAKTGEGSAVILGYEASMMCFQPGNDRAEEMMLNFLLGSYTPPFACEGALAYRLASEQADHYFLINEGPDTTVILDTPMFAYRSLSDAITGETLQPDAPIKLLAHDGRWLRFEK